MEFEIGNNLKLALEKGQFGPYVRLVRGDRWIVFAPNQWKAICRDFNKIKREGKRLSAEKEIIPVTFQEMEYVSFHRCRKHEDKVFDCYINLNIEEWGEFVKHAPAISDNMYQSKCRTCGDLKIGVNLHDGRMLETRLSPSLHEIIKKENATTQNQEGLCCEYCGASALLMAAECHCHKYDCLECEPKNFCSQCKQLTVCSA